MMKRLAAALLTVLWLWQLPLAALGAETAPVTVTLPYSHVWKTDDPDADDSFTYRWTSETAGAPMPEGSTGTYWDWTLKGNISGTLTLSFPCDSAGVYLYRLSAWVPSPVEGYTYEPRIYLLTLVVQDAPGGGLQGEWNVLNETSGAKVDRLDLDPSYTGGQPPTEAPTERPTQSPTSQPARSSTGSGQSGSAKTGDENHIRSMAAILLASALLLIYLVAAERTERRKSEE